MKLNGNELSGLRVLNTRPLGQNTSLSQTIQNAGGTSIELPAFAIESAPEDWSSSLLRLDTIQQAIFVSTNAVIYFFTKVKEQRISWNPAIKITAIGKATATALENYGVVAHNVPLVADSEHLLALEDFTRIAQQNILLIKGENGRPEIANTLRQRGANLLSWDVYKRVIPYYDPKEIAAIWQDDKVDIILFTSEEAIHNIFALFGKEARPWLCKKPCLVISQRIAKAASLKGMKVVIQSSYETILDSLCFFNKD